MPIANILRSSKITSSFRVEQIRGMFDVPNKTEINQEWNVELPIEDKPWDIGLIVGQSGSGKTTIANEIFKDSFIHTGFEWKKGSILDDFDETIPSKEIVETLSSVGLSSPPHWLKPYAHLSNGQKFRAELARLVLSGHKRVVFDEFTSVVDRDVAKVCCATLAKTIRRKKAPQLVAVSCHFDIIDWLQPDWIFDVGSNRFEWRLLRRRPEVVLRIYQTNVSTWNIFKGHHYLSADINKASQCFVATWNENPVAFCAVLHFPHPHVKNFKRAHRTVVLPDYQGIGIGNSLSEFVGEYYTEKNFRFVSTTSHPSMIKHRSKSPKWRCTQVMKHKPAYGKTSALGRTASAGRMTASFEYVNDPTNKKY